MALKMTKMTEKLSLQTFFAVSINFLRTENKILLLSHSSLVFICKNIQGVNSQIHKLTA